MNAKNWRKKVELQLNMVSKKREHLMSARDLESSSPSKTSPGKETFGLTAFESKENLSDREDSKTIHMNLLTFNNKSVELLKNKFHPNTGLSKDTLKKFFQTPR